MKLYVRNILKAILQYLFLPFLYFVFSYQKVNKKLVIFADSKNDNIPYSMKAMYKEIVSKNYVVESHIVNYSNIKFHKKLFFLIKFMKSYTKAKYVFICDYFIPVSSCNKKKETTVIQLWHGAGILKKFGYDSINDLGYKFSLINPTKNWDIVTVSSKFCMKYFMQAFKLNSNKILDFGVSRTDLILDKQFMEKCKKKFYDIYPDYKNKKIVLWAPTFRGNVGSYYISEYNKILSFVKDNHDEYVIIIKLHPHLKEYLNIDSCNINTEELYGVVDLLITDYSSILYDFILLKKKVLLFVPDFTEYLSTNGLYINLAEEFKFPMVSNIGELKNTVSKMLKEDVQKEDYQNYIEKFLKECNGNTSKRLLEYLEDNERDI